MVGHTHHDNDQYFSGLGSSLKKKPAHTWDELVQVINSSHPQLEVAVDSLHEVVDFSSFILNHINNIVNISRPHHFHFCKRDGDVQFRSRMFKDTQWSSWMNVFKPESPPSCQPQLVTVSSVKVIPHDLYSQGVYLTWCAGMGCARQEQQDEKILSISI